LRFIAGFLAALSLAAHGEDLPLWEAGLGLAGLGAPDYRGSAKRSTYLVPVPVFVYRGDILQIDRERMRGLIFRYDAVELDLSVAGSVPVRSEDNPAREGMPDLDPILELGTSLNLRLVNSQNRTLKLRIPVRAQIASDFHSIHSAGVVTNPNLNLDVRMDDGWRMGFVAGALFASRRNHGYYYDVAPEFAREGRPAYQAPGGYSGAQFIVALSRRFGAYFIGGFVKQDVLRGAAFQSSPLVQRLNGTSVGIALTWTFAKSARLVPPGD
jgi:MipA family protein